MCQITFMVPANHSYTNSIPALRYSIGLVKIYTSSKAMLKVCQLVLESKYPLGAILLLLFYFFCSLIYEILMIFFFVAISIVVVLVCGLMVIWIKDVLNPAVHMAMNHWRLKKILLLKHSNAGHLFKTTIMITIIIITNIKEHFHSLHIYTYNMYTHRDTQNRKFVVYVI